MLAPTISVDSRGVGVLAPTISVDSERHGASIFMLAVTISVDWQRHAVQLQIDTDGSNQQETPANGGGAPFLLLGVGVLAPTINVDSERHGASNFMTVVTISVDLRRLAVQLQIDTDGSNQHQKGQHRIVPKQH